MWTSICCCLCNASLCVCDPAGPVFSLEEQYGLRDVESQTDPVSEPTLADVYKPIPRSLSQQRRASTPIFFDSKRAPGADRTAFRHVSGEDDEEEEDLELVQLRSSKTAADVARKAKEEEDASEPQSSQTGTTQEAAQVYQPTSQHHPKTADEYRAKELERHRARMLQATHHTRAMPNWREEREEREERQNEVVQFSQSQSQSHTLTQTQASALVTEQQQLVTDKEGNVRQAREKEAEERRWADWNSEREKERERERERERIAAEQKREKEIMKLLLQQQPRTARLGSTRPPPQSRPQPLHRPPPVTVRRAADVDVDSYLQGFEPAGVASMTQLTHAIDLGKGGASPRRLPSSPDKGGQNSPPTKPERQKKKDEDGNNNLFGGVVSLVNPWGW